MSKDHHEPDNKEHSADVAPVSRGQTLLNNIVFKDVDKHADGPGEDKKGACALGDTQDSDDNIEYDRQVAVYAVYHTLSPAAPPLDHAKAGYKGHDGEHKTD